MTRNNRQQPPAVFNGREYSHHQLRQLLNAMSDEGYSVEIVSCGYMTGWKVAIAKGTAHWTAATRHVGLTPMVAMRIALERMEAAR